MDDINALTQIDYVTIVITIFLVLFGVRQIIEIGSYYKKKFRLKTGNDVDKEELEDRLSTLEKHDKWQYNEISKISKGIENLQQSLLDKTIEDYRHAILDMASAISLGRKYSKEQYDHIILIDRKYMEILDKLGLENGQVTLSMQVINEKYKEGLLKGFDNI